MISRQQSNAAAAPCTTESPEYLELEAISQCLDNILSKLSASQLETVLAPALALAQERNSKEKKNSSVGLKQAFRYYLSKLQVSLTLVM